MIIWFEIFEEKKFEILRGWKYNVDKENFCFFPEFQQKYWDFFSNFESYFILFFLCLVEISRFYFILFYLASYLA